MTLTLVQRKIIKKHMQMINLFNINNSILEITLASTN